MVNVAAGGRLGMRSIDLLRRLLGCPDQCRPRGRGKQPSLRVIERQGLDQPVNRAAPWPLPSAALQVPDRPRAELRPR